MSAICIETLARRKCTWRGRRKGRTHFFFQQCKQQWVQLTNGKYFDEPPQTTSCGTMPVIREQEVTPYHMTMRHYRATSGARVSACPSMCDGRGVASSISFIPLHSHHEIRSRRIFAAGRTTHLLSTVSFLLSRCVASTYVRVISVRDPRTQPFIPVTRENEPASGLKFSPLTHVDENSYFCVARLFFRQAILPCTC